MSEQHPAPVDPPAAPSPAADLGHELGLREHHPRSHRRRKRGGVGCLVLLVLLALIVGVMYVGLTRGVEWARDYFADPEDYAGPGTGVVLVEVASGENATDIAATLEEEDVVASAEAFIDAANARPEDAAGIQAGFYQLKRQMKADEALDVLADPSNIRTTAVVIPEGFRVEQIVARLAQETGIPARRFEAVLDKPRAYGLPAYAKGNPEGYLFPATYAFPPRATPATMLSAMVDRYEQALGDNDIQAVGARLGDGYTPEQIMTVASLVEAEGRGEDMPKIARAIYNRLELPDGGGTNGLLQIDAAVLYALGTSDPSRLVAPLADLVDSPYNTYRYAGLPPGPIGSPGEAAILAALHPAEGDWVYWVTVDCDGTTEFSTTLEEHNQHDAVDPASC